MIEKTIIEFLDLPDELISLILRLTEDGFIPHMSLRLICRQIRNILDEEWSYLYRPIQYVNVHYEQISHKFARIRLFDNKYGCEWFYHTSPNRSLLSRDQDGILRRGALYLYAVTNSPKCEYPGYQIGQSHVIPDDVYAYQIYTVVFVNDCRFYLRRKYLGHASEEAIPPSARMRTFTLMNLD